jgi:hypothetical protein
MPHRRANACGRCRALAQSYAWGGSTTFMISTGSHARRR